MNELAGALLVVQLNERLSELRNASTIRQHVVVKGRSTFAKVPVDAGDLLLGKHQLARAVHDRFRVRERRCRGQFELNIQLIAVRWREELLR